MRASGHAQPGVGCRSAAREEAVEQTRSRIEAAHAEADEVTRQAAEVGSARGEDYLEQNRDAVDRVVAEIVDFLATPEYTRG